MRWDSVAQRQPRHGVIDRKSMPIRAAAVPHEVAPDDGRHAIASFAPFRSE
jgi:hypothetical protein